MTMANLILGVRVVANQFQRIKLDNINLDGPVKLLKCKIATKINTKEQGINLVYSGILLEDAETLSSYGVKTGVMIHVLPKKNKPAKIPIKKLSEAEIQQLVVAFRAFTLSSGYRTALQKLSKPEVLENIIAATPGLSDDPVAIAMIQDPELIVHMSDTDTVRRIAEHHPCLIEAANHIAAHVHEEVATVNTAQPGTSTGYSYSLEALSDDEEMDSSSSDPPREGHSLTRNASYNAITAAQLAAALANAHQPTGNGSQSAPTNSTGNIITHEMFSNAIQHAIATQTSPTTPSTPSNVSETFEAIRTRLRPQLQQMREIGLSNEAQNIRALQATSGDVQAAIDLVFNGVID